jgi:F0F1-type ATP synthase membrane subunit c/vacuolar-type H+-ATPase subunit K
MPITSVCIQTAKNSHAMRLLLRLLFSFMFAAAKIVAAGLATLALAGAAIGIGIIFAGLLVAVSRNPSGTGYLKMTTARAN